MIADQEDWKKHMGYSVNILKRRGWANLARKKFLKKNQGNSATIVWCHNYSHTLKDSSL